MKIPYGTYINGKLQKKKPIVMTINGKKIVTKPDSPLYSIADTYGNKENK